MSKNKRNGGCSCGAVRYEITLEPFYVCHCHCRKCRGSTGAAVVTWMTVPKAGFRITQGELRAFDSSEHGVRCFCPACGSHVTFEHKDFSDDIDVTVISLDKPERLPPEYHIWTEHKIGWVKVDEHLPKHRQS